VPRKEKATPKKSRLYRYKKSRARLGRKAAPKKRKKGNNKIATSEKREPRFPFPRDREKKGNRVSPFPATGEKENPVMEFLASDAMAAVATPLWTNANAFACKSKSHHRDPSITMIGE
jgi:hypothetical protein